MFVLAKIIWFLNATANFVPIVPEKAAFVSSENVVSIFLKKSTRLSKLFKGIAITANLIFLSIFSPSLIILFRSFLYQRTNKTNLSYNKVITPFMFLFLIEIFPVKSTGSFFTTGNATYLFLIMSITIALSQASSKKI